YGNLITGIVRFNIPYIYRVATRRYIGKHIAALPHTVFIKPVLILSVSFNIYRDHLVVAEVVGYLITVVYRGCRATLDYRKGSRDVRHTVKWCWACYLYRIVTRHARLIAW